MAASAIPFSSASRALNLSGGTYHPEGLQGPSLKPPPSSPRSGRPPPPISAGNRHQATDGKKTVLPDGEDILLATEGMTAKNDRAHQCRNGRHRRQTSSANRLEDLEDAGGTV
jgi:hypothetical protein